MQTGVFGVNTIIVPLENGKCFVVDPAATSLSNDENVIVDFLEREKLECIAVILTHSHFDHITGIYKIIEKFPSAKIICHEDEFLELQNPPAKNGEAVIRYFGVLELIPEVQKQPSAQIALKDNQNLGFIDETLKSWICIHTPGHTLGSMCLYSKKDNVLISGDTLFDYGGYGRTDMPGGDEIKMQNSLSLLKKKIPSETIVYPGHDSFGFKF